MEKDIIIIAIESSCDETSVAVIKNGREVLANVISSQIEIHKRFGGVVPEVASRNHVCAIDNVFNDAIEKANINLQDIDAVAVTYGAGLVGALMVGVNFAKALAYSLNKPLIKVNHIFGHIAANYIANIELEPPFMCLVVSGGHTSLIKVNDYCNTTLVGSTLDDACGEAFDKVARVLGLQYPGGPNIEKHALNGKDNIIFKTKNSTKNSLNFSFSGLKTAVINYCHQLSQGNNEIKIDDISASFQKTVADELAYKSIKACKQYKMNKLVIAGGVSANNYIKNTLKKECEKNNIEFYYPPLILSTDNAAMVGSAAYYSFVNNIDFADLSLTAVSRI